MRCPDCSRFVSFDEPEVEVMDEDVQREDAEFVQVSATVTITLNCAECGTALKECMDYVSENFDVPQPPETEDGAGDLTVEVEATPTDRYETTDRKGKKITNPRYQTHYYGAELVFTIRDEAGNEHTRSAEVEQAASAFEELV